MSHTDKAALVISFFVFGGFALWMLWIATAPPKDERKLREVQDENRDLRARVAYLQTENNVLSHQLKEAKTARRKRK